jgi:hypothetical protein
LKVQNHYNGKISHNKEERGARQKDKVEAEVNEPITDVRANNEENEGIPLSKKEHLIMMCWQNYSGVRMAKLLPNEKYDLNNDEDFNLKISTMGLFFPAYKDVMVHGL